MKNKNEILKKIAYYSLLIWCGLPIVMMLLNPIVKGTSTVYFYIFLNIIGIVGIINFIIYLFNNKDKISKIKFKNKLPFLILIIFLLWTFISCLLADNKLLAFMGTKYRHDGFLSYICYAGFFLDGLLISSNKKYIHNCFKLLIISSSLMCLFTLFFHNIFIDGINMNKTRQMVGVFSNENHFAYYLTITTICSLFYTIYENKIYGLLFLLNSYMLIKNDTFGSYLAVLITIIIIFIFYLIKKENKKVVSILLIMFIIISIISPNVIKNIKETSNEVLKIFENKNNLDSEIYIDLPVSSEIESDSNNLLLCAGNSRLDLWVKGLKLSNKKKVFGYGLENLREPYSYVVVCDATDRPHNTFIQILMTTGYGGLILWLSFIFILLYNLLKNIKKLDKYILMTFLAIISYMLSSFFGNTMFYTTPYYILLLGISCNIFLENKKSAK